MCGFERFEWVGGWRSFFLGGGGFEEGFFLCQVVVVGVVVYLVLTIYVCMYVVVVFISIGGSGVEGAPSSARGGGLGPVGGHSEGEGRNGGIFVCSRPILFGGGISLSIYNCIFLGGEGGGGLIFVKLGGYYLLLEYFFSFLLYQFISCVFFSPHRWGVVVVVVVVVDVDVDTK